MYPSRTHDQHFAIGSLLVLIGSYRFISVALFLNLHTPRHFHRLGHRTQGGGIGSRAPEGKAYGAYPREAHQLPAAGVEMAMRVAAIVVVEQCRH
ncbi:hypothetical protein [Olivibacter sitiensis]|uniref:hypothetical protein n=1 Tax=Olivibacter sitiensis TaxID=376470 RepID=UPI0012FAA0E4|nr:hypothetical protein [Olivibacter sitiensis]